MMTSSDSNSSWSRELRRRSLAECAAFISATKAAGSASMRASRESAAQVQCSAWEYRRHLGEGMGEGEGEGEGVRVRNRVGLTWERRRAQVCGPRSAVPGPRSEVRDQRLEARGQRPEVCEGASPLPPAAWAEESLVSRTSHLLPATPPFLLPPTSSHFLPPPTSYLSLVTSGSKHGQSAAHVRA